MTKQIMKLQTTWTSVILDRLRAAYLASHFMDPASLPALPYALLMSVLQFMPASLKWHPLFVSVLPFTHASFTWHLPFMTSNTLFYTLLS
jgi:hypothetical protein